MIKGLTSVGLTAGEPEAPLSGAEVKVAEEEPFAVAVAVELCAADPDPSPLSSLPLAVVLVDVADSATGVVTVEVICGSRMVLARNTIKCRYVSMICLDSPGSKSDHAVHSASCT